MSTSTPCTALTFSTASLMIDSVRSPRKSILIRPTLSTSLPSNSTTFSSASLAMAIGANFSRSSWPMITPQACTPVWRIEPSSFSAYLSVLRISWLGDSRSAASSGDSLYTKSNGVSPCFLSGVILSGTSFDRRSLSERASFCTRATSLMAILGAMVPNVTIWATRFWPYFCTQ